jgi:hypothetical protein
MEEYETRYVKITTSEDCDTATVEMGYLNDDFIPDEPKQPSKWIGFIIAIVFIVIILICGYWLFLKL